MELIIPFMLFILEIRQEMDDAGDMIDAEISLSRHPVLYLSREECEEAGKDVIEGLVKLEHNKNFLRSYCEDFPGEEEAMALYNRLHSNDEQTIPETVE